MMKNNCRVDKDADGRITEEEVKEVCQINQELQITQKCRPFKHFMCFHILT